MTTDAEVASAIETNNGKLCAALAAGDAAGAAALYAKGARLMAPNMDFIGHSGLAAYWQGALDMGVKDATLKSDTVEVHGDTAIEVGRYTLFGANRAELDHGKYVVVWKNEGGAWKLSVDIFNSSVAAG